MGECAVVRLELRICAWRMIVVNDSDEINARGGQRKGWAWTSKLG